MSLVLLVKDSLLHSILPAAAVAVGITFPISSHVAASDVAVRGPSDIRRSAHTPNHFGSHYRSTASHPLLMRDHLQGLQHLAAGCIFCGVALELVPVLMAVREAIPKQRL